ncbi:hypothetical protein BO443_150211 [Burkholderia orbicola]
MPHLTPPEYVGEPVGVAGAPTSDIRCAAMLELAGNQDRAPCTSPHLQETLRSAIQIRHARNARQASTQATRTSRRRGGRDHICGAVYSLIEENYVPQEGRRAAVEEDRADFALSPDPRYVTVRPASWPSPFLLRLKRVYHFSMRLFRDEI